MKLKITLLISIIFAALSCIDAKSMPTPNSQQAPSSPWVEVGMVKGIKEPTIARIDKPSHLKSYTTHLNGDGNLKLYVMRLGDKKIYRVEYHGVFYSVANREPKSYSNYNACADINDFVYINVTREDGSTVQETVPSQVYFNLP